MKYQMEKEEKSRVILRTIRASGWLFMEASRLLQQEFGLKGEMAIRQWLRTWGIWRGNQLRKGHMAMGKEINCENLVKFWDSAAAMNEEVQKEWENGHWNPCNVKMVVPNVKDACPQSALWMDNDFWLGGHFMCDEFHIQFVRGYHPDAVVVIPECIMKNDGRCNFNFVLAADAQVPATIEHYEGEDVLLDWDMSSTEQTLRSGLRRKSRITTGRVYFLREVIYEMFPERAEALFETILTTWFMRRGQDIKAHLEENKTPITPLNILKMFDQEYLETFNCDIEEKENKLTMTIPYCPIRETWNWISNGKNNELKTQYCNRCYSSIIKEIDSSYEVTLESCLTNGDDACCITIKTS